MTHSYKLHFFHFIWATKERRPHLSPEVQSRLYPYMGTTIRNCSGKLLEIGGMSDHIHLLVELNNLDRFSHFIREIKACSSLWIHKQFIDLKEFAWQEGYGSFSVSYSGLESVKHYIRNQEKHHATMSFEEEYLKFLKVHQIVYDERFVFG